MANNLLVDRQQIWDYLLHKVDDLFLDKKEPENEFEATRDYWKRQGVEALLNSIIKDQSKYEDAVNKIIEKEKNKK